MNYNYSDELKVIWLTPMRTATRACGFIQRTLNFDVSAGHGMVIPPEKKDYFLMFNIRNPYSRLASIFTLWKIHKKNYDIKFENWVKMATDNNHLGKNFYTILLHDLIKNLIKPPDVYIRFESLESDLNNLWFIKNGSNEVKENMDIHIKINRFNDSPPYQGLYNQELADLVYFRLENEFKIFNYSKDSWKDGTS